MLESAEAEHSELSSESEIEDDLNMSDNSMTAKVRQFAKDNA